MFGDGECFAAVDSDQDDGELGWVEVASTGNKRLAPTPNCCRRSASRTMPRYELTEAERAMYREKGYVSPATVGPAHLTRLSDADRCYCCEHRFSSRTS